MDRRPTWKRHIDMVTGKAKTILERLDPLLGKRSLMPLRTKLPPIKAILKIQLMYRSAVWGYAAKAYLKKLETTQKNWSQPRAYFYEQLPTPRTMSEIPNCDVTSSGNALMNSWRKRWRSSQPSPPTTRITNWDSYPTMTQRSPSGTGGRHTADPSTRAAILNYTWRLEALGKFMDDLKSWRHSLDLIWGSTFGSFSFSGYGLPRVPQNPRARATGSP